VKLPIALLPDLLAYARRLDAGEKPLDIVTKSTLAPPVATPEAQPAQDQSTVLFRLVEEKRDLEKRVAQLKGELEQVRGKLEKEEARTAHLRYQITDAGSVLKSALKERRDGLRTSITASAVKSALSALGIPDKTDPPD